MKKMLVVLIALLTLIAISCHAALAEGLVMRDPMEFSDSMEFRKNLDSEHCYNRNYIMDSLEDVPDIVLAYLENLMQYEELAYAQYTVSPDGWIYHVFTEAEGSSYDTFYHYAEDSDWRTMNAVAAISYKPSSRNVYFSFSLDFTLWAENEAPTPEPTARPTAKPTDAIKRTQCDVCEGTGKCPDCGGDMWWEGYKWVYVNGSPESRYVTELCDGRYCYGGTCDRCNGDGWLD